MLLSLTLQVHSFSNLSLLFSPVFSICRKYLKVKLTFVGHILNNSIFTKRKKTKISLDFLLDLIPFLKEYLVVPLIAK